MAGGQNTIACLQLRTFCLSGAIDSPDDRINSSISICMVLRSDGGDKRGRSQAVGFVGAV
jgi:hypothetical protein